VVVIVRLCVSTVAVAVVDIYKVVALVDVEVDVRINRLVKGLSLFFFFFFFPKTASFLGIQLSGQD